MNPLESYLYTKRDEYAKIIQDSEQLIRIGMDGDKDIWKRKDNFLKKSSEAQMELRLINYAIDWYEQNKKVSVGVGSRFYSDYFKSCGTVVEYKADDNWWFILDTDRRKTKARANVKDMKWIGEN